MKESWSAGRPCRKAEFYSDCLEQLKTTFFGQSLLPTDIYSKAVVHRLLKVRSPSCWVAVNYLLFSYAGVRQFGNEPPPRPSLRTVGFQWQPHGNMLNLNHDAPDKQTPEQRSFIGSLTTNFHPPCSLLNRNEASKFYIAFFLRKHKQNEVRDFPGLFSFETGALNPNNLLSLDRKLKLTLCAHTFLRPQ